MAVRGGGGRGGRGGGGFRDGGGRGSGDSQSRDGGDCRGYRGRSGGGGGGPAPLFLKTPNPYTNETYGHKLDIHGKVGWLDFPDEKEKVVVQRYTGEPASWALNRVNVSVNHFLVESLNPQSTVFPIPNLFHYDINYEVVREKRSDQAARSGKSGQQRKDSRELSQQLEDSRLDDKKPPTKRLSKYLAKAVLDWLLPKIRKESNHYAIATDGNFNLYSTKRLEAIPLQLHYNVTFADLRSCKLFDEDDNATVHVTFNPTMTPAGKIHTIDTNEIAKYFQSKGSLQGYSFTAEVRQSLEAACNAFVKSMPNFQYFAVGRSTMVPCQNSETRVLGGGLVAWKGLSANISMGWKPYLNVDIANCAFIMNKPVLEVIRDLVGVQKFDNVGKWTDWDFENVRSLLRTCKVGYTIDGMRRGGPIRDIPNESVGRLTFLWESEQGQKKVSIFNYYLERYGKKLACENGPLLELRKKGTYVPAELCTIKAGQSYNRKLDGNQTTNMLDFAKRTPAEKVNDINGKLKGMNLKQNPVLNDLGIQIANNMLQIKDARVLVPPSLRYGPGKGQDGVAHLNPEGGNWEIWRHKEEFSFYTSAVIKRWGVLVVGCPDIRVENVNEFVQCLKKNADRKGVAFYSRPDPIRLDKMDRRRTTPERNASDFANYFTQDFKDCDMVLVVIPEKGSPLYGHVKHAAEVEAGMMTQCTIKKHLIRVNDSVVQNILLKINSKMGGTNHVTVAPILEPAKAKQFCTILLDCPVMILGADVTHAPPGSKKIVNGQEFIMPSYAAVTGSLDPTCMPFMTEVRAQRKANAGAAEVIQDLENITLKFLQCYKASWFGKMPRKIIYFRDGVGDGQFPELLHIEMTAIRKACARIGKTYEPKITFITVQKRHKTRMFLHTTNGRIENVPAGTVIDKEIVHPTETDFYLCSHKGMLGTSRPSRYRVLWDDSEFSHNQLQSLAYTLCYMYARCTKSVKMPAATYYAHLAADRAKKLCEGFETKYGEPTEENLNRILKRGGLCKYPMHFI